jgi:hypothetical protein
MNMRMFFYCFRAQTCPAGQEFLEIRGDRYGVMEEEAEGDGRVLYYACVVQAIQISAFSLVPFVLSPEKLVEKFAFFFLTIASRGRWS